MVVASDNCLPDDLVRVSVAEDEGADAKGEKTRYRNRRPSTIFENGRTVP